MSFWELHQLFPFSMLFDMGNVGGKPFEYLKHPPKGMVLLIYQEQHGLPIHIFSFYALRFSCDLSLLDLFGSFSPWEGSGMGVLQPMNVLLYASLFAFTYI